MQPCGITLPTSHNQSLKVEVCRSMVELNIVDKIILKISGNVFTEHKQREGWRGPLPFYAFKCKIHGLVESYPQGYRGRLDCPKCVAERE